MARQFQYQAKAQPLEVVANGDASAPASASDVTIVRRHQVQYQSKVEPFETGGAAPETITLDKWFRELSLPVRRKWGLQHLRFYFSPIYQPEPEVLIPQGTDVAIVKTHQLQYQAKAEPLEVPQGAPEEITVDKWFREASHPVRRRRDLQYPSFFSSSTQYVETLLGDWQQPQSQPTRRTRWIRGLGYVTDGALLETPNTPTLDRWSQPTNQPYRVPRKLLREQFVIDASQLTQPEAPLLKWLLRLPDPVRAKRRPLVDSSVWPLPVEAPAETVTLDKWNQPLSTPTSRRKRAVLDSSVIPPTPETITLEKWYSPETLVPRARRRARIESTVQPLDTTPAAESITLDKWFQAVVQPGRVLRRSQPDSTARPVVSPDFLPDWFRPTSEPVRRKHSFPYLSGFFPLPQLGGFFLEDWQQPQSRPTYRRKPATFAQIAMHALPITDFVISGPVDTHGGSGTQGVSGSRRDLESEGHGDPDITGSARVFSVRGSRKSDTI